MAMARRHCILGRLVALGGLALAVQFLSLATSFVAPPAERSSKPDTGVGTSTGLSRRSGIAAGLLGLTLAPGVDDRAMAKPKKPLGSDDYGDDISRLDGLLTKDWNKAVDETKCKLWDEGERRSFCVTKEINEANRKKAEAEGKTYVDQKATLSKGSYGT